MLMWCSGSGRKDTYMDHHRGTPNAVDLTARWRTVVMTSVLKGSGPHSQVTGTEITHMWRVTSSALIYCCLVYFSIARRDALYNAETPRAVVVIATRRTVVITSLLKSSGGLS